MAKAEMNLDVALTGFAMARPGDTLILTFHKAFTKEAGDSARAMLMAQMTGLADVVIVGGSTGLAVYRPDGDDDAR